MNSNDTHNHILVVDDEPNVREMLHDFFTLNDFECSTAENGERALGCAKDGPFDLIIMDVKMPGLSGIDTLRAIKQVAPGQQG